MTPHCLECVHLASYKSAAGKGKVCLFLISSLSLKESVIDDGTEGCSLLLFRCFHLQNMQRGLLDDGSRCGRSWTFCRKEARSDV